ncbi:unnamed protein product [Clonostachys byssicola]|uniref:Uncharacterized protein n=1 Tax=Clonostachys byssicola TaxID=160290 RepID=A0A9N9V035_9HYPO|nr:unnamed protein product [Clonostachys byssicola]
MDARKGHQIPLACHLVLWSSPQLLVRRHLSDICSPPRTLGSSLPEFVSAGLTTVFRRLTIQIATARAVIPVAPIAIPTPRPILAAVTSPSPEDAELSPEAAESSLLPPEAVVVAAALEADIEETSVDVDREALSRGPPSVVSPVLSDLVVGLDSEPELAVDGEEVTSDDEEDVAEEELTEELVVEAPRLNVEAVALFPLATLNQPLFQPMSSGFSLLLRLNQQLSELV